MYLSTYVPQYAATLYCLSNTAMLIMLGLLYADKQTVTWFIPKFALQDHDPQRNDIIVYSVPRAKLIERDPAGHGITSIPLTGYYCVR